MLVFLDSETTGLEQADRMCSIACLYDNAYIYELINEGKKICSEASSLHHITNEMIEGKNDFKASKAFSFLNEHNNEENILIAHNVNFDLEKLAAAGLMWKGGIVDTLRVSKHMMPECDAFSLQFLRYELKLYREEEKLKQGYGIKDALLAHNALGDAVVTQLLFNYLHEMMNVEEMKELSFKAVLLEKLSFGKHKGKYIEDVCMNDISYARWLLSNDADEDVKYSINYYLEGNL